MKIVAKILQILLFALLLLYALFWLPTLPGWCVLAAAILVLPVKGFQTQLDRLLPRKAVKIAVLTAAVVVLLILSIFAIFPAFADGVPFFLGDFFGEMILNMA